VEKYRRLAEEARRQAAHSKGSARASFLMLAEQWDRLAETTETTIRRFGKLPE
jgi:hypothetical protein